MLRAYDLSCMEELANAMLNDPTLRLVSMEIFCSKETAYTVASLRFAPCTPRETRYNRYLARHIMLGPKNHEVDQLLTDKNVRLLKQYVFPTSEGTVVVLDYQVRKGKAVAANGTV